MYRPILFNTEMVKAILDGRKTVTRRCVKPKYSNTHLEMFKNKYGERLVEIQNNVEGETYGTNPDGTHWQKLLAMREIEECPPCRKGDILWVRETWCDDRQFTHDDTPGQYFYKASSDDDFDPKWRPSIHMPKEAARIFLKVTDVRVERLKYIIDESNHPSNVVRRICAEGIEYQAVMENYSLHIDNFKKLWNSTIKPSELDTYGWNANPYVWVIEFERCEEPSTFY